MRNTLLLIGITILSLSIAFIFLHSRRDTYTPPRLTGEIVPFPSGTLTLHGVIYKPEGTGPYPALLYNHGSAEGMNSNEAFERLGPMLVKRGWIMFAPYRRGQGLSRDAGPYIVDEMSAAARRGGDKAYYNTMVRLLTTDHLNDQLAAFAWLKQQKSVQSDRIAVIGNSFGGIETVLGAERVSYCAAIDATGAADTWEHSPELQSVLTRSVRNSRAPIFFLQAENDYSLAPTKTLSAAMKDAGKTAEAKIYPRLGNRLHRAIASVIWAHPFGSWMCFDFWSSIVQRKLEPKMGVHGCCYP
jgi:carboxymethylenebutenolidase